MRGVRHWFAARSSRAGDDRRQARRGARKLASLVAAVAIGGGVFVAPGTAHADTVVDCAPYDDGYSWTNGTNPDVNQPPNPHSWVYHYATREMRVISSTPTFNVSDTRFVSNPSASPITGSFTSSQSHTYGISLSVGLSAKMFSVLQASVSVTVQRSWTTQVGVTANFPVPARTVVYGDYGVNAYTAVVEYHTVIKQVVYGNWPSVTCIRKDPVRETINVPTNGEGWRVRPPAPL